MGLTMMRAEPFNLNVQPDPEDYGKQGADWARENGYGSVGDDAAAAVGLLLQQGYVPRLLHAQVVEHDREAAIGWASRFAADMGYSLSDEQAVALVELRGRPDEESWLEPFRLKNNNTWRYPTTAQVGASRQQRLREFVKANASKVERVRPEPVSEEPPKKRAYGKAKRGLLKLRAAEETKAAWEDHARSQGMSLSEWTTRNNDAEVEFARSVTATDRRHEQ